MIKCYKSRCPESDYNRTKYRMRGFHSDTYFTVRVTYSTQHTWRWAARIRRDKHNAANATKSEVIG